MTKTIAGALALALLAASASAAPFTSRAYGFRITPPSGWTHTTTPGFEAEFFVAPDSTGGFRPNINVLTPIATQGMPPAEVCELNARNLEAALSGARVLRQKYDPRTLTCELVYTGRPNGAALNFYAQLRFTRGVYHTLTYTARGDAQYRKWLPQAKAAFASFRATP